jgi:PAS domain S-box-containing protein
VSDSAVALFVPSGYAKRMPFWKGVRWVWTTVWFGGRKRGQQALELPLGEARYRTLFDNTPVQILEEDFTAVVGVFSRLRAEGITNLMTHLAAHPDLSRELLGRVRLSDANQPAIVAAGCASKPEMIARFPQLTVAPYPEIFDHQLERLWTGRRLFEEEFRYLDANGQECACLMQCKVSEREEQPDPSRVVLVLLDITAAKRTVAAQMENQEVLRQILGRANILLWWASVRREGGHMRWKINVPSQSFDSPIVQLATARERGGLWEVDHAPDLPETSRRAEQALLNNSPGYQQEFRVLSQEGITHWLSEEVGIRRLGEDDWNLVGVVTDVTARHEAEEARKASEAQLHQILSRADCMLWQAHVTETNGRFLWQFQVPASGLQKRIFDSDAGLVREGVTGDKTKGFYRDFTMPEQAEMDARSMAAMRSGAPGYEQEFRLVKDSQTFWLHERVSITPAGPAQWDLVGMIVDVTAQHEAEEARQASEAQLQQILARADCMLWRAKVVRDGAATLWRNFDLPTSGLYTRLQNVGIIPGDGRLWPREYVPERPAMDARATRAILSGAPGYEQEFYVTKGQQSFWMHEQVMITPVGPDEWSLVGVIMDVTAQHEAEEARKASEAQLRQILTRADCLLWQAHVVENAAGALDWFLYIPQSSLYRELFGEDPSEHPNLMWSELNVPELAEMNARSRAAIRGGAPGYEQEFRALREGRTYWLHEQVSITPVKPGHWNLVGVITNVTARREAEEERKKSEEQLQQILTRADCILWQANIVREGDGVRWRNFEMPSSVLYQRLFGTEHPISGTGLWLPVDTPDLPEMNRRSTEAILSGAPGYEQEFPVLRAERTLWLHEQVSIMPVGPDEWNLVGVLMDVTERRKALVALRESEARYRLLFENIPVAILELDFREMGRQLQKLHTAGVKDLFAHLSNHPEESAVLLEKMRVVAVNDTAVRLYKAESKEVLQDEFSRLYTADAERVVDLFLKAAWEGRNDGEEEMEILDFAGGRHHAYLRWWMPREEEWLKLEHAVVALVDLTELKRAEAALAAEKERLTVTLRAMTEGVITTDTRGVVQFMNRAAAGLTQQEAATAVGRPLAEVCILQETPSNRAFTLPVIRVLEDGVLVDLPPQIMLVGRKGATCLVEGCCVPVREANSELIGTVLVIRDVTVRQRFEQELQRASRLESIGILAGGIAHDFNNILTAIMGNLTLALLDAEALSRVERYLREAERATLRARDLTQQLLTFAKGGDPVRSAVRLPEIITEVAQFALHGSRVKCEFDLPANLWPANADKGQLGQVVQNLVINAVQAMPEGGTIRISTHNEAVTIDTHRPLIPGDYVHISVADTGTGIKAEHLAKIFDPYFTTKQQGSGLGLTTVYSIIRKHNGHIEVESELGRGTTFHLWLPALREQQLDLPEDRPGTTSSLQGRVLFMDDEEPIIEMAGVLLQRLGFEVEVARDGSETVQKFEAAHAAGRPFDLVVMDLTVPGGMGGREAIEHLRRIDPGVKAIVSSGYSSDPVLANYRTYGFRGMVAKPYKIDDFTRVLREALRESRSPIPGKLPGRPEGR